MLPISASIDYTEQENGNWIARCGLALALFGSSSVSGLPESHYSKLAILAPRQLRHALSSSLFVVCARALIKQEARCCEYDWRL